MELDFISMAASLPHNSDEYCKLVARYKPQIATWLKSVKDSADSGRMFYTSESAKEVFSVYKYKCACGTAECYKHTMIEPLAFLLRHPAALCAHLFPRMFRNDRAALMSGSFLFFSTKEVTDSASGTSVLIDLGAAVRPQGRPFFLLSAYEYRGVLFDRILLWEAEQATGSVIFSKVPKRWFHAYQFFNVPVTLNSGDDDYPLNVLNKVATKNSFVAIKIDIDHSLLENAVIAQVQQRGLEGSLPFIQSGHMELFYEHHVNTPLMLPWWLDSGKLSNLTLLDSYNMFSQMRKQGIRAHGWY